MTTAFRRAMALGKVRDGLRHGRIDASWHQGRGAFGGLLAALALEAMGADVADPERAPRSLTIHFCAPASEGPFELTTEIVRAGSRVTTALARVVREGKVTTLATASFCKSRDRGERHFAARMPAFPPAREVPSFSRAIPGVPPFVAHFDHRYLGPPFPFSGATRAEVAAWVRLVEPEPHDAATAALLVDVLPPAISAKFDAPRPLASVDFRVDFLERFPLAGVSADDHLLVAITSRWADDGYTEELRDLWTADGRLVAQCRQLIALM
jgi:acyl-CoA thioesterase